jgi:hypothetical protein
MFPDGLERQLDQIFANMAETLKALAATCEAAGMRTGLPFVLARQNRGSPNPNAI